MALHTINLALFLNLALAGALRIPARIRDVPSMYRNSTTPVLSGTTTSSQSTPLPSSFPEAVTTSLTPPNFTSLPIQKNDYFTSISTTANSIHVFTLPSPGNMTKTTQTVQYLPTSIDGSSTSCINTVTTFQGEPPIFVTETFEQTFVTTVQPGEIVTQPLEETIFPPRACSTTVVFSIHTIMPQPTHTLSIVSNVGSGTVPAMVTPTFSLVMGPLLSSVAVSTVFVTKKTTVVVTSTPAGVNWPLPTTTGSVDEFYTTDTAAPASLLSESEVSTLTAGIPVKNDDAPFSPLQSVARNIANLVASAVGSPSISANAPTQTITFVPVSATPTIAGVVFSVGPSKVVVGSQTISLPTSSETVFAQGSQTFTLRSNEIVGPSTTYQIKNQLPGSTFTQAPSIITTTGMTLTVGPSAAIISGTTYKVGSGAVQTTITVNSQKIVIGTNGVAFGGASPTTFAPPMTIASGREVVVVDGTTVLVDQTAAVISGTTFRIGSGATSTAVDVGGKTITLGPDGVVLASTTIHPTSVPTVLSTLSTSTSMSTSTGSSRTSLPTTSASTIPQHSGTNSRSFDASCLLLWLVCLPLLSLLI